VKNTNGERDDIEVEVKNSCKEVNIEEMDELDYLLSRLKMIKSFQKNKKGIFRWIGNRKT
jgi:hypothetical protein